MEFALNDRYIGIMEKEIFFQKRNGSRNKKNYTTRWKRIEKDIKYNGRRYFFSSKLIYKYTLCVQIVSTKFDEFFPKCLFAK